MLFFSPDSTLVAAGGGVMYDGAGQVQVWEVTTGRQVLSLVSDRIVQSVAFSPDGLWLATGGWDHTARVWALTSSSTSTNDQEVARFTHTNLVIYVSFSQDGQWLATTTDAGQSYIWMWRPDDLIKNACGLLNRNFTTNEWMRYFPKEPYQKTCPNLPPGT